MKPAMKLPADELQKLRTMWKKDTEKIDTEKTEESALGQLGKYCCKVCQLRFYSAEYFQIHRMKHLNKQKFYEGVISYV